jgi:hypothetical protein
MSIQSYRDGYAVGRSWWGTIGEQNRVWLWSLIPVHSPQAEDESTADTITRFVRATQADQSLASVLFRVTQNRTPEADKVGSYWNAQLGDRWASLLADEDYMIGLILAAYEQDQTDARQSTELVYPPDDTFGDPRTAYPKRR